MEVSTINGIKFTPTEIKVIACFSVDAIKPSTIARILNKSTKTIYGHLDKIKSKTNSQTFDGISLFVKKSGQFRELNHYFKQQYIDYYYRETSKKIAYKLKPLNVVYNLIVLSELKEKRVIDDIIQSVELTGVKIKKIDDLQVIKGSSDLDKQPFCVCIARNIDEIKQFQVCGKELEQNNLYIVLNQPSLSTESKVLFFETGNKKQFYKFLINHLVKNHQVIANQPEALAFLTAIDNIEQNIQFGTIPNLANIPTDEKRNNQSILPFITYHRWKIIITAVFVGIAIMFIYYNHPKETPKYTVIDETANKFNNILVYYLPPRNSKFTGREDAFKQISSHLTKSNIGVITQAIVGAGGIGKTQLATEYAYRAIENKKYDSVLWVTAETPNSINDAYGEFANKLNINIHGLKPEQIRKIVHNKLLKNLKVKKILFVLDNVPNKKEVKQYLQEVHDQFPIDAKPHVLITSRSQHWTEASLVLDIFTPEEAKLFVKKHLPNEIEHDSIKLTKTLHYFPLALGQAVGFIKQHTNIADYLKLYSAKKQQYLDTLAENNRYTTTLWKTLSIALTKLSNHAKEILKISSYLEPDNIQLELFNDLSTESRVNAIKELRKYSFVILTNNRQSFKIHRLLQEVIRLSIKTDKKWINKATKLANQSAKDFDKKDNSTWSKAKIWLLHITTLTQYMQHSLGKANLLHDYGKIAKHFGLYTLAQECYLESIKIKKSYYQDPNHIALADTLSNLGFVEWRLGYLREAVRFCKQSLKIKEAHYQDPNHIALVESLNKLGLAERFLGNYEIAKSLYQRALKIQEVHYQDPNHIELADNFINISYIESIFGNYRDASKLCERAVKIKEAYYNDPNHIALAIPLNCLGRIKRYLANYNEAKQIFTRSLKIQETHYKDPNQIELAVTVAGLGRTEKALGNYTASLKYSNRAYEILYNYYGDRLHEVIHYEESSAEPWSELSLLNRNKAIMFYKSRLAILKKIVGDKHHSISNCNYMLGQAYEARKQFKKAIAQYELSLLIAKKVDVLIKNDIIRTCHQKNLRLVQGRLNNLKKLIT